MKQIEAVVRALDLESHMQAHAPACVRAPLVSPTVGSRLAPAVSSRTLALAACAIALTAFGCNERTSPVLTRLMDARRFAAELEVSYTKSVDATNRAVMADTDETSAAFAHEAEDQTQAVQTTLELLAETLHGLGYGEEIALLAEFRAAFAKSRALDREILALAVENTNLKAQRLSFGPAYEAANALRDALGLATNASGKDGWRLRALAASVLAAVREIEVLQAPHIAAADDATMTGLETQMAALGAQARTALQEIAGSPELQAAVAGANEALARFDAVNAQLIALSRRNSNVRSLALSLGQKRTLTSVCEGSLQALNDRLSKRNFAATR